MAIREISKGKYQLIVDEMRNGKRFRKTKIVECGKRELNKLYDEFKIEVSKPTQDSCTVETLLNDYISHCEVKGESRNTTGNYRTASKRIISALGDTLAKDLTPYALDKFVASQAKIYAPKTVHNTIGLLSAAYTYAINLNLLNFNPCEKVDKPKLVQAEKKILDNLEAMRFLDCVYAEPLDNRVALLLAFLGLRKSEITGLREEDISTDFNTIRIRHARFGDYVKDAKTDKSQRVIVAPQFVMDEIVKLIAEHHDLGTEGWLIQYCARPVSHSKLHRDMKRFREKNGFDITLHGLRHTLASLLASSNGEIDIAEISKTLGHSNISITLNTYTHVFKNQSAHRIASYLDDWRKSDEFLTNRA